MSCNKSEALAEVQMLNLWTCRIPVTKTMYNVHVKFLLKLKFTSRGQLLKLWTWKSPTTKVFHVQKT